MAPLNLCYLAAYGRQHHPDAEFKIIDSEAQGLSHEETVNEAELFSPRLIGITTNTCVFDSVIKLIKMLKRKLPDVPIIIGGPHASSLPERSLLESGADFAAIGEGELTFSELISQIKTGLKSLEQIDGLAYHNHNGTITINSCRGLIQELDLLPFPARDLIENSLYIPPPTKRVGLGPNTIISTSRGCPFNCGFCGAQTVWSRKIRFRKPNCVVEEIKDCVNNYGIMNFNFTDEFFTANKDRVLEICDLICKLKLNISWVCSARAQRLDKATLEAMKEAGCHEISFGIESGNQNILKKIDKSLNLDEALETIRATKKAGIKTHASYILGYIDETEETIKDTINFAKKLNTHVAAFFIASPLPGTRLYAEALEKGYLRPDATWADYSPLSNKDSVLMLPELPIPVIRKWHRKAIRSYYMRPKYLILKLMSIRHWYDIINLFNGLKLFLSIKK
ncbi:MAG: radical SAM protein [Nitrospirae bacterium]|nr:radical SAM protein [Nitrospirota bacterium]